MHRRQTIREAAATAIAAIGATVDQERARRANETVLPLVVVRAQSEQLQEADGTMGEPTDRRALSLAFDVYAGGSTGAVAVDKVNDLDEAIGVALGVAMQPAGTLAGIVFDLRWSTTEIEIEAGDQDSFTALASIIYTAQYDVYYGNPT